MTVGLIALGLVAGVLSGLIGLGGGIFIVPALVLLFGFTQHNAQGTTLAVLIPPIGILAAYTYYQRGHVNISAAALICVGFVLGGLIGAKLANAIPTLALTRVFAVFLVLLGLRMFVTAR
jgi:uncharacterized membrane protein YfcA